MQTTENTTNLDWFKIWKPMVDSNVENLTIQENGWLMGPYLQVLMEGNSLPVPEGSSPVLRYAAHILETEIKKSIAALDKSKADGSKGGHQKADNARQKAVADERNGVYHPPKITAFKQMCAGILQRYGNKKESAYDRFSLYLPEKRREALYNELSSNNWNYSGIKITDENILKSIILVQAVYNEDEHYNGEDRQFYIFLIKMLQEMAKKKMCIPGEVAERLSELEYDPQEGWRFYSVDLERYYTSISEYIDAVYADHEKDEEHPEEKPIVPFSSDSIKPFKWGL